MGLLTDIHNRETEEKRLPMAMRGFSDVERGFVAGWCAAFFFLFVVLSI
jgi:hypothetical protein